ncbi:MAG: hypothetical protein H6Q87_1777 [candidate division NC10 bacterium]|nr:hypothetical protein [candidate division NC10 bacterium]
MSTMSSTTLSAAVTATASQITVASETGITVYSVSAKTPATHLFVDRELMEVTAISGTTLTVKRGVSGIVSAHESGAKVWLADPDHFSYVEKAGYEASPALQPLINPVTGEFFNNITSRWISNMRGAKGGIVLDPVNSVYLLTKAGAPTDGTSGDGAGHAGPGSLLVDFTNANLYINTNTAASPTWTVVGTQS